MSIQSFADKETQYIFHGDYSSRAERQLPREYWEKAQKIMDILDQADKPVDTEPYNWREKKGDLSGSVTLDINNQYRIMFRWDGQDAHEVFAGDPSYHN